MRCSTDAPPHRLVDPGPGDGEAVDHGDGRGEVGGHGLDVDVELPALVPALLSSHSSCVRVTCICWIRGIQAMESATSTRMNSLQCGWSECGQLHSPHLPTSSSSLVAALLRTVW